MLRLFRKERNRRAHDLKSSYDVVIVGAGVHGLGIAYYLGKIHGVKRVALMEKSYLGSGNSGRNTAILRSNYRTPEGIPFYDASVKLYEGLSQELDWNLLFSQCGHLTVGHTDSAVTGLRVRAENNQVLGVDSRMVYPDEIRKLVPSLDLSNRAPFPIMAGGDHPPGGHFRHHAGGWGYARARGRVGVWVHPCTPGKGGGVGGGGGGKVRST